MKKLLLSSVAALAATSGAVLAADLPYRRAAPAPAPYVAVPVFTWTGFYIGGNAGYAFAGDGRSTTTGTTVGTQNAIATGVVPTGARPKPDGFSGGGQIGYNYQVGSVVLGAEADIQYTDLAETRAAIGSTGVISSYRTTTDYVGTVRGRVGYAFNRFMVYGTGGLAYGDVYNRHSVGLPGATPTFFGSKKDTETGYAAGGGVEYALPSLNLFNTTATVKVEYLYYNLGDRTIAARNAANTASYVTKVENDGHLVRAGLNFKFGGF